MTAVRAPRSLVAAFLAAGLLAAVPAVTRAQQPIPRGPSSSGGGAASSGLADARKQVTAAEQQVNDARKNLAAAKKKLEAQFLVKPEWNKTKQALDRARLDEDRTRNAVLAALEKNPQYKAARTGQEAARKKYQELQSGKPKPEELDRTAQAIQTHGLTMKALEKEAMDNDPKYLDAKSRLAQAQQEMSALQSQVDQAAQTDPECVAAQQALDQASQQLEQSKQSLAQQAKAEAEARAAAAKAKAQQGSQGRQGYGGGGGGGRGYGR